jgi:hypothetical protein
MSSRLVCFAISLCLCITLCAQDKGVADTIMPDASDKETTASINPTNAQMARGIIKDMRTRGLIVRLNHHRTKINNYRKAGYSKLADELEQKYSQENNQIIRAFVIEFTFCPVYFMDDDNSQLLARDTLVAMAYSLDHDTVIPIQHDSFWVMDYGSGLQNVIGHSSSNMKDGWKDIMRTVPSQTPSSWSNGLIVKDHHFDQLQAPFPWVTFVVLGNDVDEGTVSYKHNQGSTQDDGQAKNRLLTFNYSIDSAIAADASFCKYIQTKIALNTSNPPQKYPDALSENNYAVKYLTYLRHEDKSHKPGKFRKGVKRMNDRLILYYAKILDKENNIEYNTSYTYWWKKSTNIGYLLHLPKLNKWSNSYVVSHPAYIQIH